MFGLNPAEDIGGELVIPSDCGVITGSGVWLSFWLMEKAKNHSNGKSRNRKRKTTDPCVVSDQKVTSSPPIPASLESRSDFLIFPDRGSHFRLLKSRNWKAVNDYWHSITQSGVVPDWISSPSSHSYGVTDLDAIHRCAIDEMDLFGKNIQRKTYAVRIGYAGSHYQV
jgi:hypothetical protein